MGVEREGGARVCVLFSQRIQILYNKIKNIFFCGGEVEGGGGGGARVSDFFLLIITNNPNLK